MGAVRRGPAVITGAASGIGRATALRLAGDGYPVAALDLDVDGLADTVARIEAAGGTAMGYPTDVTDGEAVAATVAEIIDRWGCVAVLVNDAGVGVAAPLLDTTDAQWDQVMAVNVTGPFLVTRAVLPHLLDAGGGIIVNVASVAAVVGVKNRAAYTTSKHALVGMTRSLAADYAHRGIRVNAICPGTVATEWIDKILADAPDPEATRRAMEARQLDGRMGEPDEVAAGISFLVSDGARFVNGSAFIMDGGMSAV